MLTGQKMKNTFILILIIALVISIYSYFIIIVKLLLRNFIFGKVLTIHLHRYKNNNQGYDVEM